MQRRTTLKFLAAGLVAGLSGVAPAFAQQNVVAINPPQPTLGSGQIEVIEFFSYGCPHCASFDPLLSQWRTTQQKDVVFKRVPISFGRPDWAALSRLYLTLEALGQTEKLDAAVFDAIHKERVRLDREDVRNDWLARKGVDVRKFNDTWRSFSVDSQAKRAEQIAAAYKVMGVPYLAIAGKFGIEGGDPAGLRSADAVIAKLRTAK
ncbi:MAG: thiol:disulfide interchange protein DsbA/DsbL [Candidatus Dactylopiibacterium sp.]|nr:thiol:disulfide interchange protein DsbA/DsbL [Candidatus Dactylopiibacterium sp.]